MSRMITRRGFALGGTGLVAASGLGLAAPALAQTEPLRIGWLAALTGPSSAPAVGFNRGVLWAAETINAAGGVKGRKLEIITRDTQGDPTKAVNATQEMISQLKVHAVWGPTNSGESLATTAILARGKMPNIHPCVVDSLIDTKKYPNAFRIAPSNTQWDDAVRGYTLNIAKAKKVAVLGDTTGYGVTAANASAANIQKEGAEVVYKANIDATQPDMTPDMLRARNAGAEAIVIWSVSTGMIARLLNTRAKMGWGRGLHRPPGAVLGRDRLAARPPGELEEGLLHRLPQLQLRRQRQAAGADRIAGAADDRQGGAERHADVVGRLRRRCGGDDRGSRGRHRQHVVRGDHRPLEHAEGATRLLR